ncbi:MAG: iron-containing alcohol dehydrogenase [Bacteroidales bacterium]|nr:iron-containing alcohol dehydrogenase [Bacteroidales bacterium]
MENFTVFNPTQLHFGKDVINNLPETIKKYAKKILLIYGKGSVVKNGYYKLITEKLKNAGIEIAEYSGIKPNPVQTDVEKAIQLGIKENVELILALGGGSVIDSSKVVALCIPENLNAWDVVTGKTIPQKALPVITILTLAATGTEMNQFAVLQNHTTNEKLGFRNNFMFPKHSFINPKFTYTVSKEYTAYGITDIIAHAFENYFGNGNSPLADRFVASIVKESMYFAPLVLKEPENYDYRANILLQSTYALNGTTIIGKSGGDWGVHSIGHILSLLYDTPHGASLSIAYPAWFRLMKNKIPDKIKKLAELIFDVSDIDLFIEELEDFFKSIGSPVKLQDAGISYDKKDEIINILRKNEVSGFVHTFDDYELLTEFMYGNL